MSVKTSAFTQADITCFWTLKAAVAATIDAVCCIPCCCFCGGCCGRYPPLLSSAIDDDDPGRPRRALDTCHETCLVQSQASIVVPCTLCLCCWCCCGTATPCAKAIAACTLNVEKQTPIDPPIHQQMAEDPRSHPRNRS